MRKVTTLSRALFVLGAATISQWKRSEPCDCRPVMVDDRMHLGPSLHTSANRTAEYCAKILPRPLGILLRDEQSIVLLGNFALLPKCSSSLRRIKNSVTVRYNCESASVTVAADRITVLN
jgi:hypothetical protein